MGGVAVVQQTLSPHPSHRWFLAVFQKFKNLLRVPLMYQLDKISQHQARTDIEQTLLHDTFQ